MTARDHLLFWLARQVLDLLLRGAQADAGERLLAEARTEANNEEDGRG